MKIALGRRDVFAQVDDTDRDVASIAWYAHKGKGDYYYAAHRDGTGERQRIWLHNMIMERVLGRKLAHGELVDHINLDKLDCRRENLRVATRAQNNINKVKATGKSKYKGVSPYNGKWRATIYVDKKQKYLGLHETEWAAAEAYNEAAKDAYGDFAVLNVRETVENVG